VQQFIFITMSLRRWSSCLERRQALSWAQHAASLLDEADKYDFDSSSSSSSDSLSFDSDVSSEDDIHDVVLASINEAAAATTILDDLEMVIEDHTIKWRGKDDGLMIEDLTEDDALSHFRFRKVHFQEVADKRWPQLCGYLVGLKSSIVFNNGNYSAPYETLFLMILFQFLRPRRMCKDTEYFFCNRRSKILSGIRAMVDALYALSIQ
jgi:hypothetical protein